MLTHIIVIVGHPDAAVDMDVALVVVSAWFYDQYRLECMRLVFNVPVVSKQYIIYIELRQRQLQYTPGYKV